MIIFQLAWRNIWRHPKRTLLTAAAISFAIMVLQFFYSLQLKSYDAAIGASTGIFHGHIQIQGTGYNDTPEIRNIVPNAVALKDKVAKLDGIDGISVRAFGYGLISSESRSFGAQIVGVEPESEGTISNIPGLVKQGEFLKSHHTLGAVVGSTLAKNLKVGVGDTVTVMSQGYDGSLVAVVLDVIGIFESGSVDLDRNTIEISLSDFNEQFGMEGSAHSIVIRTKDVDTATKLLPQVKEIASNIDDASLDVLDWERLLPGLKQSIDLDMSSGWLFYFSLIIIVSFSILNTFLMSVLERSYEFGVILSLGGNSMLLAKLVLLEALFLTLLGVISGTILGISLVEYFGYVGFTAPGAEEILKQWNLPSRIYPGVSLESLFFPTVTVALAAMLSVIYPMIKVFRIAPIKALKGEV